ncbi:MAG: NAD(P)-dependent oxidoreductase [Candidatus Omnitrophota bacterium]
MKNKVLLLGSTGKMGTALMRVFQDDYPIIGKNSRDFDATDLAQVARLIEESQPKVVLNTVAFLGIDPCEQDPMRAFKINTLYPKYLAELSKEKGFLLVHFSTDAVFSDQQEGFCKEGDTPCPLNVYGLTKYGGDCFIQTITKEFYIFRVSILFGETSKETQFVEKMLKIIKSGQKVLKIADDIISSPSYSKDIAKEARRILEMKLPFGLYHIGNEGRASLFNLMQEIVRNLGLDVRVERCSYKDFPFIGVKNTCTPLESQKLKPLRPWQEAVKEYCSHIKEHYK